jgi:CheY-like chemotaxis protein
MAPAPKPERTRSCILVVDDDVLIRLVIAEELRAQGFLVVEAATADQALSYVQAGVQIDLVLSDVEMPGSMNGVGLVRHLSAHGPNFPIILTSGADPGVHNADAFVLKPCDVKQLTALIATLLHERTQ